MKNLSNELKVGLFIIFAFGILFYMTFNVSGSKLFSQNGKRTLVIYFTAITGVTEKADVRMAGVKIGEVQKIELADLRARVTVSLYTDLKIPDDSVAQVQGKGLLGEKFIEIRPGASQTYMANGGVLERSISPANIDDLVGKLADVLDDVKKVSASMRDAFGSESARDGLKEIVENLANLSKSLDTVITGNQDKLRDIIINIEGASGSLKEILAENRADLRGTMGNFNTVSKSFAEKTPELLDHLDKAAKGISEMVNENRLNVKEGMANIKDASGNFNGVLADNRENFKATMENLKNSSEKLDLIMKNIRQVSAKLEKGEGTIGRLIQEDEVYTNLNQTLESTNSMASKVEHLKIAVGARTERQIDQQRNKGYFSIRIQPREDKYYMFEISEDVRRPLAVRNQLNALLYSFYIAKRYGNVTLKAGLFESSAGLGSDLHGWDDKLELSLEAFNLSGYDALGPNPQIKVTGRYYPQKYIFLYVGGDELINQTYRTYFAGVGILADEEDFKFFLGRLF